MPVAKLNSDVVEKLAKLTCMLASDDESELLATAYPIKRTLKGAGHDLHDLADHLTRPAAKDELQAVYDAGIHRAIWHRRVSQKQQTWIEDLYLKTGGRI